LDHPLDYYLALHKLANNAEQRISMSALYLGTGKLERYLVDKLNKKMQVTPDLKMTLLFDYMRGTRIEKTGESSHSILKPIKVDNFNKPVRVGFFHMPDTGLLKGKYSASPLREVFGVHHIKAHVFDDNVLITGANLSEDYFTDRQDRFFVIQDCEPLANYFDDLISGLTDCSFNMDDDGELHVLPSYPIPYQNPKKFKD